MAALPPEFTESPPPAKKKRRGPFHFLIRGLAIILPPILTLLILIWVGGILHDYILQPTTGAVRFVIAQFTNESRPADQFGNPDAWMPPLQYVQRNYVISPKLRETLKQRRSAAQAAGQSDEQVNEQLVSLLQQQAYVEMADNRAVPYSDYADVAKRHRPGDMPRTTRGLYMDLVATRYFGSLFHLSAVAILVGILLLYFIGRFVTARLGAWMVNKFESGVLARVPLVSRVYASVKQVTDFFFTERTVDYNRVVAVEYPRRGVWSVGFVTSDSLLDVTAAAGEPLVSVLMPTSPMPMTGFTISVPRNEVVDLNMTVDQAFQFCLSCGVLVPPQQKVTSEALRDIISQRLALSEFDSKQKPTPAESNGDGAPKTEQNTGKASATTTDRQNDTETEQEQSEANS